MTSRGGEATTTGEGDDLRLPDGTVVLHIGPPKTGTSTLQGAFHVARAAALRQGVRYVGRSRHSGTGVLAVTGRPSFRRDSGPPPMRSWNELVREIRTAPEPRVLLSSEFFADAEPDAVARIVGDLAPLRLHIVVTLRPLAAILPSQWQQYVQSFMPLSYDDWLDGVFNEPRGAVTPTFWRRHRHDELIDRWAIAVGAGAVTAVVVDDTDHDEVLRTFERLLGLDAGTLVADSDLANRSMSLPEIEAVRAFNIAFREAGLGNALYHRVMHFGAAAFMRARPLPADEPRIETPGWALERAAGVEREMVDRIALQGIRVVGDLERLVATPEPKSRPKPKGSPDPASRPDACVPSEIAARMSLGVVVVAGQLRGRRIGAGGLDRFAAYKLGGALVARIGSAALRGVSRLISRGTNESIDDRRSLDPTEVVALAAFERTLRDTGMADADVGRLTRSVELGIRRQPRPDRSPGDHDPDCVPPSVAAAMGMGALMATGVINTKLRPVRWTWIEPPEVAVVASPRLAGIVVARLARGALRALRSAVGRRRTGSAGR